ncbi:hypothetical protein CNBE4310 [Cryptococcus deneoformans B-3501A]|uniref:hypothetical protein n=1 Tax=Cryptococcus deneoformans (strain B-3501A) TaxID=283643 RepID=UPI000042DE3C|nr:hypothetical protein CNBE4310 [Cryptococcus neoformans var. neoformans B-3501A]EAL20511.1 hypothetical protein CNBE4310 [Cryptococcus neoformans var. neoformans B-3501A]
MGDIADLTTKTYDIARLIPPGRVTSYDRIGQSYFCHIAKLAGYPTYSRHVGNALKMLPADSEIPWQRVVNSKGIISPRGDSGLGVARQKERLEDEGVEVETLAGAGGEKVDLRRWGWFPETLPQDREELSQR